MLNKLYTELHIAGEGKKPLLQLRNCPNDINKKSPFMQKAALNHRSTSYFFT